MTDSRKFILIIEDNADIARLVSVNIRNNHIEVDHAADGVDGLSKALSGKYQLIILDLMLPGMDGIDICQTLRNRNIFTPILMLTARTTEMDRVCGLEIGADDYLTKPFSVPELVARVGAMLRRSDQYQQPAADESTKQIMFAGLHIDSGKREVRRGEDVIDLTAREFDLLWYFSTHPGQVYTRSQLLNQVWGYGHDGYEHTVNSHINRLRAKIEPDPAQPTYVLTVWGVGYKFSEAVVG